MRFWADRKGSSLVEFAIVCLLLFTVVFGIIEFGMLMKSYLTLNQAVREGVRSAALGSPLETVVSRVQGSAPTLTGEDISPVELYARGPNETDWGEPLPSNTSRPGDQVMVRAEYPHQLITGNFFSWLFGNDNEVTISANMVMRRE